MMPEYTYKCTKCKKKVSYCFTLGPNLSKNFQCDKCKPPRGFEAGDKINVSIPDSFNAAKGFGE